MATPVDDNRDDVVEEAVRRFVDARWRGAEPDVEGFVQDYPGWEDQIRESIQDARRIDALFDSLVHAEECNVDSAEPGADLKGRMVGAFEITEMLGRGGMGVVYLAHDTKLGRSVAVKSIPAELQTSPTAQARLKREAKLLASLNHPNIAVIHDIIEADKSGYLILEYVPGQTLAERIASAPLKLQEALSIGQQIAEAVAAAHAKGVVHRDLKPGNTKITPEGKVKVLDFGLAKASPRGDQDVDNTVTQPGRVMGTPAYMSPEQARGNDTDHRTDIWSFGCIMYQMLTGRLPFEGETATDTIARILEREPNWQALAPDTPARIRTLLHHCLEKDPRRRLQDIGDAIIEIGETLNRPVTAPPVTTPSSASLRPQVTARHKRRTATMIAVAVGAVIALCVIALQIAFQREVESPARQIRLVVLPFENLGSPEGEYFADGITDAITARLAGIHGLAVISRQSAIQYKSREKDIRQIAEELRVDYVLEGTVQRERPTDPNNRVRIIPQLINASDDTHVWTEIYDDDMREVFRLQSDVAEYVAKALDIALLEPERRALASRPTQDMAAYDYYLRGYDYDRHSNSESDKRIAIRMYEKAIERDPMFALAYVQLSHAHRLMYWFYYDRSDGRLAEAKEAVDRALELDPELPEAHVALGLYFYHGGLQYDLALEQFAIARKSQPHNRELTRISFVQRRQGRFEQALKGLKEGYDLDPLSHIAAREVGTTLTYLRWYAEAERYYSQAISLAPDLYYAYYCKAWLCLCSEGNTEEARAVLTRALESIKPSENPSLVKLLLIVDVFEKKYQGALDRLSMESRDIDNQEYIDDREYFVPNALLYARIYGYMSKTELEQTSYESARSILESQIKEHPDHARFRSALGIAYAGLGRKEDAIREGKLAVEMLPVSKEAMRGPYRLEDLARIYVMVDEHDKAIDQLEYLLSIPGPLSIPLLQLDPAWDPLRSHSRFQELLKTSP